MRRSILLVSLLFCSILGLTQEKIAGTFQTNFPTYGMFGETLTLNCDHSAVLNFRGDLMNDNSVGIWGKKNNLLTLTFDSTLYPKQRYKGQLSFEIKNQKLYIVHFTKEYYDELKAKAEKYSKEQNEEIKLPSYSEFKKQYSKTPKNYYGKSGIQYFKKIESFKCS